MAALTVVSQSCRSGGYLGGEVEGGHDLRGSGRETANILGQWGGLPSFILSFGTGGGHDDDVDGRSVGKEW